MTLAMTCEVGALLSGKYALRRILGTGGMGTVYEADNVAIGRRVAVKILDPVWARHRHAVERFEREARAAARIGHPNIVEVFDLGTTEDDVPYIVLEHLEGEDLHERLSRRAPLEPSTAVDVACQVLSALGA